MHILIVAHGKAPTLHHIYKSLIAETDYVIACDGGYTYAHLLGITSINDVMGDFDSLSQKDIQAQKIIPFPKDKEKTDLELAVEYAISKKPDKITIIGATGDRLDHTFHNIFLLARFPQISIKIIDQYNEIFVIEKNKNILHGAIGQKISFIPLKLPIKTIHSEGLRYQLNAEWFNHGKLSISNEFTDLVAMIYLDNDRFLVIKVLENR